MRDLKEAFKQLEASMRALDERISANPELNEAERDMFYQPIVDIAVQLDRLGHLPEEGEGDVSGLRSESAQSMGPESGEPTS